MKKCFAGMLVLIPMIFTACSPGTDPEPNTGGKDKDTLTNPNPVVESPSIKRPYEPGRGGVQITRIYFHQDSNFHYHQLRDEWVVLESDRIMSIKGWRIDASDGQIYNLPDTIYKKLYIYTHTGPTFLTGPEYKNDTIMTLKLPANRWIWNNTDPDTGKLLNADSTVVDSITYDAKK